MFEHAQHMLTNRMTLPVANTIRQTISAFELKWSQRARVMTMPEVQRTRRTAPMSSLTSVRRGREEIGGRFQVLRIRSSLELLISDTGL